MQAAAYHSRNRTDTVDENAKNSVLKIKNEVNLIQEIIPTFNADTQDNTM